MSTDDSTKTDQPDVRKKRIDQALALLWIVAGIVIAAQTRVLKYMGEYGPGPGFLPSWLAGGFILLGVIIFVQATFSRKEIEAITLPNKHSAWQMVLVMLGFFSFVFLAERVGFILCVGLLFLFLLTVVEKKRWKFSLAAALISMLLFWIIFEKGLKLHLPMGVLEWL